MRKMFVSDLDNTLVGDERALRSLITRLEAHADLFLVFATGRSLDSVLELMEAHRLPRPHAIAARVGTRIFHPHRGGWREDRSWRARMARGWDAAKVHALVDGLGELERQPDHEQDLFKCSYFVDPPRWEAVTTRLRPRLEAAGLGASFVFSAYRNLDLLPAGAGKGPAVRYLLERTGIDPAHTLICGDSGNDASMLALPCRCVAVGNSSPELLDLVTRHARHVYRARGCAAAGILEGIDALCFLEPAPP